MNKTIKKYLNDFSKSLEVDPTLKNKIISDISYDIEKELSNEETAENIIAKLGNAKDLAQEFNQNYPEYRETKKLKKIKFLTLVSFIVAGICSVVGLLGRYAFFNSDNVSRVGGVSLPTEVITTSEPISVLFLFDTFIKFSIVVAIIALVGVVYLIVKSSKRKDEHL